MERKCTLCHKVKDILDFYFNGGDQRRKDCKECFKESVRERRKVKRKEIEWRKQRDELGLLPHIPFVNLEEKYLAVLRVDEKNMEIMKVYCEVFGCGKQLTLTEKLCGDRCIKHQYLIDSMSIIDINYKRNLKRIADDWIKKHVKENGS